jgi:hypothetical protein
MKIKSFKLFQESNSDIWYRGSTSKTNKLGYSWYSKEKSQANKYADMNAIIYGGKKIISETTIDLTKYDLLDLLDYDMDERYNESEIQNILEEINIDYDYEDLFDFTEDDVPLSRLINNLLKTILKEYDGLLVLEDGVKTICIKAN